MKRLPDILPPRMRGLRGYSRFIGYCYASSPAAVYLGNPGFYIGIRRDMGEEYVRIATFATFRAATEAMQDDAIMRHLPTHKYSWTPR
jgi:hypothetical protein